MKNKKLWWIAGALAVIILFIVITQRPVQKPQVFKIGAILPLTGNLAFLGEPERDAIQLAIEEINSRKESDIKLEVSFNDSKGDPATAVTIANKLLSVDRIKFFITGLTGVSLAVQPLIEKNQGLQFAISIHPTIPELNKSTFRIFYDSKQEAEELSAYYSKLKPGSIVILHSKDSASEYSAKNVLIPKLKELGIQNIRVETFDIGQKDFRSVVTKILSWKIKNLIILGYGSDFPGIIKELEHQKALKDMNIAGGIGFLEYPKYSPPELVEGVVFVIPKFVVEEESEQRKAFVDKFKNRFKTDLVPFDAAYAYDNIMILGEALIKVKSYDAEAVKKAIIEKGKYNGVSGEIKIKENGDSVTTLTLVTYKNGKIVPFIQ